MAKYCLVSELRRHALAHAYQRPLRLPQPS